MNSHQNGHQIKMATQQRVAILPLNSLESLVPGGGVEPQRGCPRRILSPLRLPVPPSRLVANKRLVAAHVYEKTILLQYCKSVVQVICTSAYRARLGSAIRQIRNQTTS